MTHFLLFLVIKFIHMTMRWLINFLFKKRDIKTNRAVLVQKIILKKISIKVKK